ncbi:ABC-type branched-chain amino acid transport system, periplasmic component [Xenococcus sp. PCC 7305]|nr:ABC-type branched-chain amino acid transport system, periplasmic component [Xenococcus sp. PCC 7305]
MAIAVSTTPLNAQQTELKTTELETTEEYLDRGISLSEQDEFEEAIAAYTQAIQLDPTNALAYYNRGLAFYHLRNQTAALEDFTKTIELRPDVAIPYRKRGLISLYLANYDSAIADFGQAATMTPDDPNVHLGKAAAHMLQGDVAEAMTSFDRAIELDSNFAIAYFLRGGAYSELGDRQAALQDYQQAGRLYKKLENTASFERIMAIVRDLAPSCYPNCNQAAHQGSIPTDNELLASAATTPAMENLGDRISFGEKILVAQLTNFAKQAGIRALAAGDFKTAAIKLSAYLQEYPNDPEARIYLNNAKLGNQKSYSMAVSVPVNSLPDNALEILRGVAQAQEEANKNIGVDGIGFKVAIADDNNNPEMTRQLGSVLGENPDILGIIGPFSSDAALVAGETYKKEQLVAISPTSTSVKLSNFSPYFFRTAPNDTVAAEALANYAVKELKVKRAAIFFNSKSGYSQSLQEEFLTAISQRGGSFFTTFDLGDPNFNAAKSLAIAEKNGVEVLMLAPDTPSLDRALEVVAANNQKLPILGGDAILQTKTREVGGENAVGMIVASPWFSTKDAESNFMVQARSLWEAEIGWRTALAYDATQALITAIKNNPSRVGVQQALTQFSFIANGASDNITFLPSGDRLSTVELVQLVSSPQDKYGYNFFPLLESFQD